MKSPDKPTLLAEVAPQRDALQGSLRRLDSLARLMDEQFRVPVVGWRVGLDPIIGLVPGGGDWAAGLVGVYIFWQAVKLDAPRLMLVRMATNLATDLIAGYVPGVGDIFDAIFKSNRKNVDLLLVHYGARRHGGELRLPEDLPARVDAAPKGARWTRYLLGFAIVLVLLGLAALPLVLIGWWLRS